MEPTLRFRADVLTAKAEAVGDTTNRLVAQRTGVRESTISRLVNGQTVPTLLTLGAIASAYGTTLDDLVSAGPVIPEQRAEAVPV